jgi:hypothetical protein
VSQSGTIQLPALPAPKGTHNDGSDPATPPLVIGVRRWYVRPEVSERHHCEWRVGEAVFWPPPLYERCVISSLPNERVDARL